MAGLDKPESGRSSDQRQRVVDVRLGDVAVVFQRYPLFDDRTVLQNLVEPAKNGGVSGEEAKAKALKSLAEFELSRQVGSYPMQVWGRQRQRVAIAQQIIQERRYVILDEPFSGLDPNNIQNVIDLLLDTAEQHTDNTFLMVTHDITSAMRISDTICILG